VELIWKHYRDDEKVVAALERMARDKSSLGTKQMGNAAGDLENVSQEDGEGGGKRGGGE
jgi:hypothetical protein